MCCPESATSVHDDCAVAVIDHTGCLLLEGLHEDTALTLIATASDDPDDGSALHAFWPRYATPVVPEFISSLPSREFDGEDLIAWLDEQECWAVIDLVQKRLFISADFGRIDRRIGYLIDGGRSDVKGYPLDIALPPWWELHNEATGDMVAKRREQPASPVRTNRAFLFGRPLMEDLAGRLLATFQSEAWEAAGASTNRQARYDFTVAVHRSWLMTPREDLAGKKPRDLLHGAIDWHDSLLQIQQQRLIAGLPLVAAPVEADEESTAPMGREEVCLYFDLCRDLIESGWRWCLQFVSLPANDFKKKANHSGEKQLAEFLWQRKQDWLNELSDDTSPPNVALEYCRRRVPRASGVAIEGMNGQEPPQCMIDCDCPICQMQDDDLFGPAIIMVDGHHLELDDEFAFSLYETREEWESMRMDFALPEDVDDESDASHQPGDIDLEDSYESVWHGSVGDEPIPGDPVGHLALAFRLAEVVSELQMRQVEPVQIKELNRRFRDFRQADGLDRQPCSARLKNYLEQLAMTHRELLPRIADLQSKIDESLRVTGTL